MNGKIASEKQLNNSGPARAFLVYGYGCHGYTCEVCRTNKAALATAQQAIITVQVALTVSFSKCSMAKI